MRQYEVRYLEDLRVANLVRNRPLSKRSRDAGWGPFRTLLADTALDAGTHVVVVVEPASTRQDGSGCGARVQTSRAVRTPVCPAGGRVRDRDEHAARNILWRGQRLRGSRDYLRG